MRSLAVAGRELTPLPSSAVSTEALDGPDYPGGHYVRPCIASAKNAFSIVQEETFAPILYFIRYQSLPEAIEMHNSVPQGLSSAIFTLDVREAELFCSATGSDCGIELRPTF